MWMMEGSVDGVNWDVLTNMTWDAAIVGKTWYSDGSSCYKTLSGRKWQEGKSFPIRGTPQTAATFNVLGNCDYVSVAQGATLEKQGSQSVVISALSVSADGFGRIDGFIFNDSGKLKISGLGKITDPVEISGTFVNVSNLANISTRGWKVYDEDGDTKMVFVKATANGIKVYPRGLVVSFR
jgi:hypothetical protein